MSREIIVIDEALDDTGKTLTVQFVCWLTAPANRVNPSPNMSTVVPPSTAVNSTTGVSWGYTAAELAALQAGTIVEKISQSQFDISGGPASTATLESALQAKFTALQNALNSHATANPHVIGASWDGTTWTAGP